MAPEQARGESAQVGEATDIHALGLLLYEMLTGQPAFQARSPADVLVNVLHHEPTPPRRLDHRIPRDLETICLKCLQKNPAARYANIGALLEDIRRYEAVEPLTARRPGWFTPAFRWCRRHWKLAAAACLAATMTRLMASQMFDRSYEDLVAWGNEELASGNTNVAAQVYSRAWTKSTATRDVQLQRRSSANSLNKTGYRQRAGAFLETAKSCTSKRCAASGPTQNSRSRRSSELFCCLSGANRTWPGYNCPTIPSSLSPHMFDIFN